MSFKHLQIRYQTARSLPAPYAYFYTLTARPTANGSLDVNFSITFPDRDDIDDDELIAEGYTRDDDFQWSGRLPNAWQKALTELTDKTRLSSLVEEELDEEEAFLELTIELPNGQKQQGTPRSRDDWDYLVQELMQAAYEAGGREAPFELTYLDFNVRPDSLTLNVSASFTERAVQIERIQGRNERRKTLPWSELQRIMSFVYEHDYDPDSAQLKRPKQTGQWLNLGSEEWYDVSTFPALTKKLQNL
ncbi:hypothetical protein ACFSUS_14615 [Spirosoma soli]|uniref:Uncharacterized protein n=1 Tax=Spirosoma soli TaxID=1770529 RepID=A0ABW5M6B0_9BACT